MLIGSIILCIEPYYRVGWTYTRILDMELAKNIGFFELLLLFMLRTIEMNTIIRLKISLEWFK